MSKDTFPKIQKKPKQTMTDKEIEEQLKDLEKTFDFDKVLDEGETYKKVYGKDK